MSPDKPVPISADGLKKLEAELEELRSAKRKEVAERIHAAMQFGDYSENSELELGRSTSPRDPSRKPSSACVSNNRLNESRSRCAKRPNT